MKGLGWLNIKQRRHYFVGPLLLKSLINNSSTYCLIILGLLISSPWPARLRICPPASLQTINFFCLKLTKLSMHLHSSTAVLQSGIGSIFWRASDPWPRDSVLGLRPPKHEFRILCLEGRVISPFSAVHLAQFSVCAQRLPKTPFIWILVGNQLPSSIRKLDYMYSFEFFFL